jgi:hypothetical protein
MRYQDDPDAVPRRLRLKQGAPRSTLEQRVTTLERKVAEFSAILNGITQQLVDVSSSVHDMTRLPGVYEHGEPANDKGQVDEPSLRQSRRRKKTAYVIADNDYPPEPERRLGDDIIIADRDL